MNTKGAAPVKEPPLSRGLGSEVKSATELATGKIVHQFGEFFPGLRHLDSEILQSDWQRHAESFAEHSHLSLERIGRRLVSVWRSAVDPLDEVGDEAGDVGQLVEVDPLHCILRRVVVPGLPAAEEQEGLTRLGKGGMIGNRPHVVIERGDHPELLRFAGGGFYDGGKGAVTFHPHHRHQSFQMRQAGHDCVRNRQVEVGGVVPHEIRHDHGGKIDVTTVVLAEPPRAHCLTEEERRLFRIEEGDDEVPLQRLQGVVTGQDDIVSHRGGVVIHAGSVDHGVIVRAQQDRRQAAILSRDDTDEIGEGRQLATPGMGQLVAEFVAFAVEVIQADTLHLLQQVVTRDVVAGLADAASQGKCERLTVFRQPLDEKFVREFHDGKVGLGLLATDSVGFGKSPPGKRRKIPTARRERNRPRRVVGRVSGGVSLVLSSGAV